jgi:hypothetical protein
MRIASVPYAKQCPIKIMLKKQRAMNIFMVLVLFPSFWVIALPNPSTNPWSEARAPKVHQSLTGTTFADQASYAFYLQPHSTRTLNARYGSESLVPKGYRQH